MEEKIEAVLVDCLGYLVGLVESPTAELSSMVQILWRLVRCRRERMVVARRLWPRAECLAEDIFNRGELPKTLDLIF